MDRGCEVVGEDLGDAEGAEHEAHVRSKSPAETNNLVPNLVNTPRRYANSWGCNHLVSISTGGGEWR